MDIPKKGESVTSTAAIDGALARHWPKRLARRLGVPLETARFWIYKGMPDARRREIARALLAEMDALEATIAETRRRWSGVANETPGVVAGNEAAGARAADDRVGEQVNR